MKGIWRRSVIASLALGLDMMGVRLTDRIWANVARRGILASIKSRFSAERHDGLLAGSAIGGAIGGAVTGRAAEMWCHRLPQGLDTLSEAMVLSSLLDVQTLRSVAREIADALEEDDLISARAVWMRSPLFAAIPCEALSADEMARIAIGRLASWLNSRAVGPLLYYVLGGLPAVFVFRWLAADDEAGALGAFWRHLRTLAWAGSSRVTAALLMVASEMRGADGLAAEELLHREGGILHCRPEDVGALAMSGALDVSLVGDSGRVINPTRPSPDASTLRRAGAIAGVTVGLAGSLLLLEGLAWRVFGSRRTE